MNRFLATALTALAILPLSADEMSPAEKFIRENWKNTIRLNTKDEGEHVGLPFPYTCPCASGSFQEMYYWDTYFTNVGLLLSDMTEQAKNNCRNMAYLINKYGFMPNGNRTYYLGNSQPPFFSRMVREIYESTHDVEWIREMYPALVKEHTFWQTRRMTASGLNRYSGEFENEAAKIYLAGYFFKRMNMLPVKDPKAAARWGEVYRSYGESGWDCTSRFEFDPQDNDWVDLNALLYGLESDLAFFAKTLANGDEAKWLKCAQDRRALMKKVMWSEKLGMFCDHNYLKDTQSPFVSVAQFYPLFTGLATKEEAAATVKLLSKIEHRYGVAGCQNDELLDFQWDYPHGWACHQYIMVCALEKYGYHEAALRIARKYVTVVDKVFAETGSLWEKYDVVKGEVSVTKEYESPKMLGWSAGVYLFCRKFIGNAFPEVPRVVTKLNDGWKADGKSVSLPHTWNAKDGEDGASEKSEKFVAETRKAGGFYAQYWKWVHKSAASELSYDRKIVVYERALPDPDPAKRYFFKCDGAAITAEVYVNDVLVGRHLGSYTAFCYEITEHLKASGNRIGVVVDNRPNRDIPVLCADYTVFGGIYRDCWLIATDTVCIDPTYYGGPGVKVNADANTGKVKVDVKTLGGKSPVTCYVDGREVGGTEFTLPKFERWSPENPKVYSLTVKLPRGDSVTIPFGFRTTGFGKTGEYLLNGKLRKLRGVNRHQDRPGQGWCVTPEQEAEDVAIIKEMGCDAVRTAHYVQSQNIYDLFDRNGIVAWVEIPCTDTLTPSVAFMANVENFVREYVAQYGHHPSICMWSLFNELQNTWSPMMHLNDVVKPIARANELFHELDATRPTVAAFNRFDAFTVNSVPNAIAINTYPGWYWAETPDITNHVNKCCLINHRARIGVSEYGSGASVKDHAWPLPKSVQAGGRFHPEEYQAMHHAEQYGYMDAAENIWGTFAWIMFDFAADTRDEGEKRGLNDKGLVTADRKTRKDVFYFYQANWTDTPVLRLVGARATEVGAAKVPVVAFSNRKEVTLKVNGKVVSTKSPDKYKIIRWDDIALVKGENTIEVSSDGLVSAAKWTYRGDAFRPGALWKDTDGKPIQAHGGSIIEADGKYWFYGENKEKTDGVNGLWHWGMRAYSSTDLYHWKDEGLFIAPEVNAPKYAMRNPKSFSDRPHILYNESTKKFVCWVKVMQEGDIQTMSIFTADKITGPYTEIKKGFRPDGFCAGDFDLVKDGAKAYIIHEVPHSQLNVAELSADYCGTVGKVTTHFKCKGPPFTREAPAHFVRNGKHYLFTSGTTGYWPNPSLVAEASSVAGPWRNLGLAARGDTQETTFDCQVSSVFKVPFKKDCYIALGDRWLPDYPCTYAETSNAYDVVFMNVKDGPAKASADRFWTKAKQHPQATRNARYVWLPVKFDGERPYLEWRDSWSLDEFEDAK